MGPKHPALPLLKCGKLSQRKEPRGCKPGAQGLLGISFPGSFPGAEGLFHLHAINYFFLRQFILSLSLNFISPCIQLLWTLQETS